MYFSGQHGRLLIGPDKNNLDDVCAVRNWSYTIQQQVLETTSLQDTDRTLLNGIRSMSGQGSLFYYEGNSDAETNINSIADYLVGVTASGKSPDDCNFGANDAPNLCFMQLDIAHGRSGNAKRVDFWAYITSLSASMSVGEVFSFDFSFEVHGAPVFFDY